MNCCNVCKEYLKTETRSSSVRINLRAEGTRGVQKKTGGNSFNNCIRGGPRAYQRL